MNFSSLKDKEYSDIIEQAALNSKLNSTNTIKSSSSKKVLI